MSGSLQRGVALAASLVLLAAVGWTVLRPAGQYRVTAWFDQTVGLYSGSDVRILGIAVGEITEVLPLGDRVRVEMVIDEDYDIPADADGRRPGAVAGLRPVRPVRARLRRRADDGGRRRGAAGAHRDAGRARPGLRRPRRAVGGARPGRRQRRRRAVGPDRHRRGQPRGQRRGAEPDAHRLLPGGARPWPRTATTCSPRWTTCRPSPPHWPPSTPRSASSTTTWPRSASSSPASGRTSPRRSPC